MGGFAIWHLLIILIVAALVLTPVSKILRRTGLSGWWSILYLVPLVNLVALWVFAFSAWPIDQRTVRS